MTDLELEYIEDEWNLKLKLGKSVGRGISNDHIYDFFTVDNRGENVLLNVNQQGIGVDYTSNSWLQNPSDEMSLSNAVWLKNRTKDEEDFFQLDYTKEIDSKYVSEIKMGVKYRDKQFTQNRYRDKLANAKRGSIDESLGTAQTFSNGSYTVNENTSQGSTTVFDLDENALDTRFSTLAECSDVSENALCVNRAVLLKHASYNINEKISAAYIMANFGVDNWLGNVGLRFVSTKTHSSAFDLASEENKLVEQSSSESTVLPSANLVYKNSENSLVRFSLAKVMSRPAPYQLTSASNLNTLTGQGSIGNPNLKNLEAYQYQLGYEYYFRPKSLFEANIFYKDIRNFIYNSSAPATINGIDYLSVTRPKNGPDISVKGMELILQHNLTDNFGILANYTQVHSDDVLVSDNKKILFPFLSKHNYNLSLFYEKNHWSTRVSYNARSKFFKSVSGSGDLWGDKQEQLDLKTNYYVNNNFSISLEGLNLTNDIVSDTYISKEGTKIQANQFENGRKLFIGVDYRL